MVLTNDLLQKIVYNVLMIGSPGSAKTMLSRRLPTIMPPLTPGESLETTRIYSAMGRLAPRAIGNMFDSGRNGRGNRGHARFLVE